MRVGQNPAKFVKEVAKPARVTVAVLNYIPFLSGFYAQALDVLKVSLNSLCQNTPEEHDLLVFDNGSCAEVQDYLLAERRAGHIQYLLLSEKNLGKGGAWNMILAGAPGEIIAYADFGRALPARLADPLAGNSGDLSPRGHGDQPALPHQG